MLKAKEAEFEKLVDAARPKYHEFIGHLTGFMNIPLIFPKKGDPQREKELKASVADFSNKELLAAEMLYETRYVKMHDRKTTDLMFNRLEAYLPRLEKEFLRKEKGLNNANVLTAQGFAAFKEVTKGSEWPLRYASLIEAGLQLGGISIDLVKVRELQKMIPQMRAHAEAEGLLQRQIIELREGRFPRHVQLRTELSTLNGQLTSLNQEIESVCRVRRSSFESMRKAGDQKEIEDTTKQLIKGAEPLPHVRQKFEKLKETH